MPRLGHWSLFGPVLFYELVRTGRRGRYIAARIAYASTLLIVLYFVYASWFPDKAVELGSFFSVGKLRPREK